MRILLLALGLIAALPAHAHDPSPLRVQAPGHDPLDCWCLARGRKFAPGETTCLRTGEGGRMAECRMETNVMSWSLTDRACPET